jgi:hypothetical protein
MAMTDSDRELLRLVADGVKALARHALLLERTSLGAANLTVRSSRISACASQPHSMTHQRR